MVATTEGPDPGDPEARHPSARGSGPGAAGGTCRADQYRGGAECGIPRQFRYQLLAGKGIEAVRPIRDEIRTRVEELLTELQPAQP